LAIGAQPEPGEPLFVVICGEILEAGKRGGRSAAVKNGESTIGGQL
jgi:hypothetical protein